MFVTKQTEPRAPSRRPSRKAPPIEVEDLTDPAVQRVIMEIEMLRAWVEAERSRGHEPN